MNSFLRATALVCLFPAVLLLHAQLSHGGLAFGLMENGPALAPPPVIMLPAVDPAELEQGSGGGFRFGITSDVSIGMEQGVWTELENGDRIWRITLVSPEARSIGLLFSEYVVPEGALVFIYNEAGHQRGAFMAAPKGRTTLAVDQTPGDRITLEYSEPAALRGTGRLAIGQVTHAVREMGGARGFGDSAECQVNAICPEGDAWRDQIRSTVLINTGNVYCTGTLLNNCNDDAAPYILTASQCLSGSPENWIFRFNWDSPECEPSEMAEWQNSITGGEVLETDMESDAALILLDDVPPPYYQVFFSGWDTTGGNPGQVTAIHHPLGDVKKISHSYSFPMDIDSLELYLVDNWDVGILESGSTGCGLWNQNGLISGHYLFGIASCDTTHFSSFARFADYYPKFKPWLGDCFANMPGLDWDPVIPILVDAAVTSITNVDPLICGDDMIAPRITLKNNGPTVITSAIITYGVTTSIPAVTAWNGNLLPGQTVSVQLPAIPVPSGDHILEIRSNAPNGEDDDWPFNDKWTLAFSMNSPSHIINFHLVTDDYGSDVTWELVSENDVVLYQGGPYPNVTGGEYHHIPFCLTNGCYTFTINDLVGDGICCAYGSGDYLLQDDVGTIYGISDGNYGFESVETFCLSTVSVQEVDAAPGLVLYPNPTTGLLNLQADGALSMTALTLFDGMGRIIMTERITRLEGPYTMDLSSLTDGMYMLMLDTDQGPVVRRVTLQR